MANSCKRFKVTRLRRGKIDDYLTFKTIVEGQNVTIDGTSYIVHEVTEYPTRRGQYDGEIVVV